MIKFTKGDIFEVAVDIRVNTVNCVGAMGAGVALAFKLRYPAMFKEYQSACKAGLIRPGKMHIWKPLDGDWIVNFPTKRDWRDSSRYEDIDAGLDDLKSYLNSIGPVSIALPALGCGNGGLDWGRVSEMIQNKLGDVNAQIYVFEPSASKRAGKSATTDTDADVREAELIGFERIDANFVGENGLTKPIFISGNPNTISKKWIALLPSRDPGDREISALQAISQELSFTNKDLGIALLYSTKVSEDIANIFSNNEISTTFILPFGILTRKALGKRLATKKTKFTNTVSPLSVNEKWSNQVFGECMQILRSNAKAVLLSDPNPDWLKSKELEKWGHLPFSYIKYEATSSTDRQALSEAGAKPIGRKSDSGAPNIDFLTSTFIKKIASPAQSQHIDASVAGSDSNLKTQDDTPPKSKSFPQELSISLMGMSRDYRRALIEAVLDSKVKNLHISLTEDASAQDFERLNNLGFSSAS